MKKLFLICCLYYSNIVFAAGHNHPLLKIFQVSIKPIGNDYVAVVFNIAPGYNIPQDRIKIKNISNIGSVELSKPIWSDTNLLTDNKRSYLAYEGQTKILIPILKKGDGKLALQIDFQGCEGIGKCYAPRKITQKLDLNNLDLSYFNFSHNQSLSLSDSGTFADNSPEVSIIDYDVPNKLDFIVVGLVVVLIQIIQALWSGLAKKTTLTN